MESPKIPLIVLMTDFGNDPYSGIVIGRILQINPLVKVSTLTNHVNPHDIRHGAFILLKSYKYFPLNTIFLVVVDPGVGSSRRAIAAQIDNYYFIGPDNGIFSPIIADKEYSSVVELRIPENASYTFHGRDVFAPAAAKLSQSYSLKDLGPTSTLKASLDFFWDPSSSTGEAIFIDHFGNIITNIPNSINLKYNKEYYLRTPRTTIKLTLVRSYFEGSGTKPILLVSSFETLEIGLRNGKAIDLVDISPGDRIQFCRVE
ncbi:MAG: SAM-dependent chlorinase/fluorinase [Candidatus Heimdallarchaeota archaeon]|nr:MAG: SAM-dependent chlorinase/fluorinase [Candidatus Heimdallarchaeota archaeon]